jgi:hypothetical protein
MEPAGTNLGRFPSKFLLMVIPGLIASGVVASVLYAVHISRAPSSSELLTDLTPQGDGLSAEERRGLTRQMLKARRENPQEPAEVRPTPTSRPADSGPADGGPAEAPAVDSKAATKATVDRTPSDRTPSDHAPPDRTFGAAPLPVARPAPPRTRPDAPIIAVPAAPAAPSGAPAPPVAATAPSAPLPLGPADPASQPAVTANLPSGVEPEPEPRGFAAKVFSSLSTVAGTAANATGNTVNWVIDLPGKAISAGGRLFGGDSPVGNQPAGPPQPAGAAPSAGTVPPPATAPPPRRNL